jgi:PAS domain S-box-containing protein
VFAPLFSLGTHTHSLYSIILLVTALSAAVLALWVVIRERSSTISWWFFAPSMLMAIWLLGRALTASTSNEASAYLWARASYLAFPLLPAAFAQFAVRAIGGRREPRAIRALLVASWLIGGLFSGLSLTTHGILSGVRHYPWGFYPRYGVLGLPFFLFFVSLGGLSLYAFARTIRRLPEGRQRRRVTQFALGYAVGFVGIVDFLPAIGVPIVPFGHIAALATVAVVGRSIRKHHLFDITAAFAAENIVFTMPDALIVCDDEGWIRVANDAACELTGYQRTELLGASVDRFFDFPLAGEREVRPREGAPIPVSVAVSSLMDGKRRAGEVIIAHDMRTRRRIEAAIRRQELLLRTEEMRRKAELEYRTLVESMNEGIIHFDASNVVHYINERASEMIGIGREQAIGIPIADFVGGELLDVLLDGSAHGRLGSERPEVALPAADGSVRWLEVGYSPVRDVDDNVVGSICILTDVTERRVAQQQIAASALQWQATFDAIQTPLVIVDRNGIVERSNRAAFARAGGEGNGYGGPVSNLGPEELWHTIDRLARTVEGTQRLQVDDALTGTTWDLSVDLLPAKDGQQQIVAAARDVTALVQLQQSLRRSETMAALGALVGGVAHEVRNPLFAISSTLDAFADLYGERQEYRQFSKVMRTQIARVNGLMSGLLDLGRTPSATLAPRAILPILDEAIALCADEARSAGVTIDCHDTCVAVVNVDERRLLQAFRNLIHNAVQFSPAGDTVTVRMTPTRGPSGNPWVQCTVADAGPGFNQEDLRQMFEPFYTRRTGGTGLGLSIARAVVEQLDGKIAAANRAEGGALISVELPLAPKALVG